MGHKNIQDTHHCGFGLPQRQGVNKPATVETGLKIVVPLFVNEGDKVSVRKPPVLYTFLVEKAITQRVGASKLPGIIKNITTKDQLEILEMRRIGNNGIRDRGTGRPTKKERREIDGFLMNAGMDDFNYPGSPDTEENEGEGAFDENGYDSIFDEI